MENVLTNATIQVYPNPTQGRVTIDLGGFYKNVSVVLRNVVGQEVMRENYQKANRIDLEVKGETGVYLLELMLDNKRTIFKVMKQ
ncbi:T9SS type A sorting domain-containing protein [Thermonema rossianum]|uniref:T9SS type A sorting domain-containing protein n=1 Tax=Thermonema rossianum TaxID=55505 RepID=UPI000571AC1E|nr:T9SS type A sorting domain-containing protein [Thermonema rossianum]